jgi:hypothetical protein
MYQCSELELTVSSVALQLQYPFAFSEINDETGLKSIHMMITFCISPKVYYIWLKLLNLVRYKIIELGFQK